MDNSFSSFAIWESGRKKPSIITTINLHFLKDMLSKNIFYIIGINNIKL
jgi:hypothetical protein